MNMNELDEFWEASTGTGWVGEGVAYNFHANAKLTEEQKGIIAMSGESESQWIREAVEMRIEQERNPRKELSKELRNTSTIPDIDRAILHLSLKKRMIELTSKNKTKTFGARLAEAINAKENS
jgi:hypothetical protein